MPRPLGAVAARRLRDEVQTMRALAVERPQLNQALLVEREAQLWSMWYLAHAKDRERFVGLVQHALERMRARGDALVLRSHGPSLRDLNGRGR